MQGSDGGLCSWLPESTKDAMSIKDWPETERPRERLLAHGAAALSESELLAVFLRTGIQGRTAIEVARDALARFGGLNGLLSAPLGELRTLSGFGPAKCAPLHAVLELGRRALRGEVQRDPVLGSPAKVREYLTLYLRNEPREVFVAVFVDARNRLLADEILFRGTLTQTSVYPREVVKCALRHNAAAVILAHNHPSGVAEPSQADQHLTTALKRALALVDIRVLDHFVVGAGTATSFAERGLM
jgi:DNA repair protein RadC